MAGAARVTEIATGIRTGLQVMHKMVCPVCKEFLGLLPKTLYHSFLYISIGREHTEFEGFLVWSEDDIVIS
jgi:uncharacterized protein YbaR (Trm112 family)